MGASSGFPVDLILFGMIAAFLVLRLRSILGATNRVRAPGTAISSTARAKCGGPGDRRAC